MKPFWKHAASIFFSFAGLVLILAIWLAGNSNYGSFAEIWRLTGIEGLFLLSFIAFVVSAAFAWAGKEAKPTLKAFSATTLIICVLPFIFFLFLLAVRFLLTAD
jgi:hypothetical protein